MSPQDSFIDEDDEVCCPLCVEELDLTDRNFRPCTCGYQICQFCYHNIRNNLNGLCPACRRPYDDKTIEFKVVTPEEIAQFKAVVQKNAKKKAEQRHKEAQKREVESLNRKHLSGLRVVQKNLVYVVGLQPGIREDELLQTLRGDKFFGQYGKIIKIVVSKAKQGEAGPTGSSLGVYVTFAKKEDAARCIAAVNGSDNGGRILRAQLGTTKYCSAYLRNENCTNKQCMFLHEPGDNDDSYSRQDVSSINSVNSQRPLASITASSVSSRHPQMQAPIQQAHPVTATTQSMVREGSKDGSDSGDGSALPSSASWAKQRSRRGSHAMSGAALSPAISHSIPAPTEVVDQARESTPDQQEPEILTASTSSGLPPSHLKQPERDPVLVSLLKAINSAEFSISPTNTESDDVEFASFPPLFDQHGGEKRRAMREQQERLHVEQGSQADIRSVPETVDEEEPESGSLQLGGEPEDRDIAREGSLPQNFHNQRRPSTQLPIQRTPNSGLFNPSIGQNFQPNLSNLSSISGRTMTPTQLQQSQLKSTQPTPSQAGYLDQIPPGMGQSVLFQQQGHNRQASRYNFANDGSLASSMVKPATNPKMQPNNNAQNGNQFYAQSMQGPPPGLKSSGTPPTGGMFGQNQAFGGGLGGSSLFGVKENNHELFRELARGRGTGSNQIHEAGKREFISSFLQQYPSASSTPAPSSSLQASLYGPQAGAFLDFGQKQKKKGKKHRHANTSSSGGSGLVDLADPSILQARMQHQQQSNAGVGQGLFGGQAQDDQDMPFFDEVSSNIDALVADSTNEDMGFTVPDPSNFEFRKSTPSLPSGSRLSASSLPHGHPEPAIPTIPAAKLPSRIVPTSAPFTPSRTSSFAAFSDGVSGPLTHSQASFNTKVPEALVMQAKQDVKAFAGSSGLSKIIASHTPQGRLQSEDFPALESSKAKSTPVMTSAKTILTVKTTPVLPNTKKQSIVQSTTSSVSQPPIKSTEKKSTPGVLNIITSPSKLDAAEQTTTSAASFPPLPTSTPLLSSSQTGISRPLATSGKVAKPLPTPKAETPTGGTTPSSTTSMFPPSYHATRQVSLASISKLERSATPSSEIISDNASITSASISRANTPPPSKVGSAPVRANTKSMQKKQRKEIQKEKEKQELEAASTKPEPETEIGPIMGRKKKQKKGRSVSGGLGGTTPAASRPSSPGPGPGTIIEEETAGQVSEHHDPAPEKQQYSRATDILTQPVSDIKAKGKTKIQEPSSPEPVSVATELQEESAEKLIPTPASVLQDLISSGSIPNITNLNFLKPLTSSSRYQESQSSLQNAIPKLTISPEDRAALLDGKLVRKNVNGPHRIMLTPNGDCVRNLTPEEEEQFLALQSSIANETGPAAFFSAKHHTTSGFALIGGRAVPNGPPAFFPQSITTLDPVSKIQRDEALSYINQYVLPSLHANSQLEKALNANAIDAEMLRTSDSSSWPSWGNDSTAPRPETNDGGFGTTHEGILATGLESMTAHFAIGRDIDRGQPLGNVSMLSLSDAETAIQVARKETEGLEKRLNALLKKNKRLLLGSGH